MECPKCISIRQNCAKKTTCNKCKEANKAAKLEAAHKASVEELKELVKADPKELLRAGNWWSKDAILTALANDCSIAEEVARLYPTKRCYAVHTTEVRRHIYKEINKARKELEMHREEINTRERAELIQRLSQLANQYATQYTIHSLYLPRYEGRIIESSIMQQEHWLEAVQKHPGILEMVPRHYRTYELCLAAMRTSADIYHINGENFPLRHVPDEHISEEMCLAAATSCNRALWFWPSRHRNLSMYIRATHLNPSIVNTTMPEPFCTNPEILGIAKLATIKNRPLQLYNPTEQDIQASLDCVICLEDFEVGESDVCQLKCLHILHEACINKWLEQSNKCPKCRKCL